MSTKRILLIGAGIALLAAGCSKANNNAQTPPATGQQITKASIAPDVDPEKTWIRFYPGETLKFSLLLPLNWWGDENPTDSHFVLRSRKGADGSKVDDIIMDFAIGPMTAKTLSAQVTSNMKGAKDTSPIMTANTDKGAPYAFATYVDGSGKPTLGLAIQYQGNNYIHLKVTGNVTHPYVGRLIQSIALTQ